MRNRFIVAIIAALSILGLAATPALAGNGTSNFYLTGGCNPNGGAPLVGVNMKFTNYDSGANQVYHISWSRTGVAYGNINIYVDGTRYGGGASGDIYVGKTGWGAHTVKVSDTFMTSPFSCSVRR